MVCVVSRVLDGHVLEQSVIYFKDVICPVLDLFYIPLYAPHAPILKPRLTPWEEVQAQVYHPCCHNIVRDCLTLWCAFWIQNIGIEFADHQNISPVRSSPDGHSEFLYD